MKCCGRDKNHSVCRRVFCILCFKRPSCGLCSSCAPYHFAPSDSVINSDTDEASLCNDLSPRPDFAVMDGDALNVSVMTLGGERLVIVNVSCRNSIWGLKCLIEKSVPGRHIKAAWMTLIFGPRVLAKCCVSPRCRRCGWGDALRHPCIKLQIVCLHCRGGIGVVE
jgi:hypothetical protein